MCKRGEIDEPIAIGSLKRFAADWERRQGKMAPPAFLERIKDDRVAIVGAGPAGLNAAYHLGRKGYQVTIFEALPVPGGMLAVGIPDFRLPPGVLEYDINFIRQHNVEIRTNQALGRDFTIEDLFQQGYKAVFLALGAHGNPRLNIPGEDAKGVLPGVDFLRRVNLGEEVEVGEKVAVIGGGDVAIDAARMAVRLGAREVSIVYRRTKEEMPANAEEVEEAEDEKIKILYLLAPTSILAENGRVKGMECVRMELGDYDESGRRRPVPVKGSEFIMKVDTIIPEVGYKPELACFKPEEGFKITRAGTLSSDPDHPGHPYPRGLRRGRRGHRAFHDRAGHGPGLPGGGLDRPVPEGAGPVQGPGLPGTAAGGCAQDGGRERGSGSRSSRGPACPTWAWDDGCGRSRR